MDTNISSEPKPKAYLTYLLNESGEHEKVQNHIDEINTQAENELQEIYSLVETENPNSVEISKELSKKLWQNKLSYTSQTVKKLRLDEKILIQADFTGMLDKPDQGLLTKTYRDNKSSPETNTNHITQKILENNTAWKRLAQFPNFKAIEKKTVKQLNQMGITQKTLNSMNQFDFIDTIYKSTSRRKGCAPIFTGEKEKFIKNFISRFEKEFTDILRFAKADERYITEVVKSMKERGCCGNIVVKDENGEIIKTPKLTIDHKNPIRNAKSLDSIAKTNLFSNFQIVLDDKIHVNLINSLNIQNKENTFKQIGFRDKNMIFAFGLSPIQQISFDYSQTQQEKRKIKEIDELKIKEISLKREFSR